MSTTLQRILVPVDGSESAEKAITLAFRLAREHAAEIVFCHAIDYAGIAAETAMAAGVDLAGTFATLDESAKELLMAARSRALSANIQSTAYKLEGRSVTSIASFAVEQRVDAIVMGTRGLGGFPHLLLGSTAEGILRTATVPVFVVHADSHVASLDAKLGFSSIAVAVDDSEPADAAAAFATELAAASGGKMTFISVIDSDALYDQISRYGGYGAVAIQSEWEVETQYLVDAAARRSKSAGVTATETVVAFGDPGEQLLSRIGSSNADLVAIGTHGRRGLRRLLLGSVAEAIVRKCKTPVVVIRSLAELKSGHSANLNDSVRAELVTA